MNCIQCTDNVIKDEEIICSDCKISAHYYCQGINENNFNKMSKNTKNKWTCTDCKTKWDSNKKIIPVNEVKSDNIKQLTESVQYMSDKFDNFNITVNRLLNEMKELKEQNTKLLVINEKLSNEVQFLKTKVDDLEQRTLEKAVEIVGIPITTNENCKSLVEEITHKLNIECNIIKAYRITTHYKTDMKIIAWLSNIDDKNRLLSVAKRMKLNGNQYNENWPQSKLYINNHLTKVKRLLLGKSKAMAKEKGYKYVWMSGIDILVRKEEHGKVIRIKEENDLNKII